MACVLKELGMDFEFTEDMQQKLGNQWHTAKKLSTARALSVHALSQVIEEYNGIGMTALSCVEAIPGLGIAGKLWKRQFQDKINVTVNTVEERPENDVGLDGDAKSCSDIKYACEEPNALLHSGRIFNFIYLEAYGNCVRYLESACHVISHRGVLCIVSTDLSTLYNKSPDRVRRIYHGHTIKNEYMKETAVRLILANLARAASRWDRGFNVILCRADENCVVVMARILKGATHANLSLDFVKKVAHCRQCQFRSVLDETWHFVPDANKAVCFCTELGSASGYILSPIVCLGPMYTGPIFDAGFLFDMRERAIETSPRHNIVSILKGMLMECCCCESDAEEEALTKLLGSNLENTANGGKDSDGPAAKKAKTDHSFNEFAVKYSTVDFPALFMLAQTHTKRGSNVPKIADVIGRLRKCGFRASKTTFDPRGIRTSASLREFRQIIDEVLKATPKSR